MTFLSLFSGIGGLDLGLERAGMRCIGQVEIDPYCRAVLAKHWPDVPRFDDVRTFTKDCLSVQPDCIVGGFPCQDISLAGDGDGIDGVRSGLWAQFLRLIRDIRPRFAVVENVAALLVPERTGKPAPISRVLGDLAGIGFDAEWSVLSACSMGAPHMRRRVFIVAYPDGFDGWSRLRNPDARSIWPLQAIGGFASARTGWQARLADPSELYGGANGLAAGMDRNTGIGNAVVPQVAEVIGRAILHAHNQTHRANAHAAGPKQPALNEGAAR